MGQIKKLDPSTILKLAAGEIIDRPVAIVKELIENSIDAGATTIKISISQGGISEIKIEDNGQGIANEDMASTIEAHATSKLSAFDDLEHVMTMGFRGEALASISEVAHVSILSFNAVDTLGMELVKRPGEAAVMHEKAREKGTTITISHLFKAIPVRFRFLKSPTTEGGLITRLVQQFSLHYPMIQFELNNNNISVVSTPGNNNLNAQFCHALNIKTAVDFQKETNGITVSGVLSPPDQTFKQRSKCWFSVNKRMVKSSLFFKAVDQALVDIIPKQHYPALVCNIECDPTHVDINIHPKKEDVKFAHPDDVFIALKRAIQSSMVQTPSSWTDAWATLNASETPNSQCSAADNANWQTPQGPNPSPLPGPKAHVPLSSEWVSSTPSPLPKAPVQRTVIQTTPELRWVAFKNKYIVVPLDDHVLIFDQHAVHERVLYDRFKSDIASNKRVSMPLLVPEYITFDRSDAEQIDAFLPSIRHLGVDLDRFDEATFILREVPQFFSNVSMSEWLSTWLNADTIAELTHASEVSMVEALQMKACKAAIKAGQKLHDAEIRSLIHSCIESSIPLTCPHGRPLYIQMSEGKLDALFLRS